ncbi:hypothetical protein GC173_08025 [bacterium]|nr:hypothetical protein [bacterium]
MTHLLWSQEVDCIRYRGNEAKVLAMLDRETRERTCDDPQARGSREIGEKKQPSGWFARLLRWLGISR